MRDCNKSNSSIEVVDLTMDDDVKEEPFMDNQDQSITSLYKCRILIENEVSPSHSWSRVTFFTEQTTKKTSENEKKLFRLIEDLAFLMHESYEEFSSSSAIMRENSEQFILILIFLRLTERNKSLWWSEWIIQLQKKRRHYRCIFHDRSAKEPMNVTKSMDRTKNSRR
jgi:hypothetical protein